MNEYVYEQLRYLENLEYNEYVSAIRKRGINKRRKMKNSIFEKSEELENERIEDIC